MKKRVLIPSPQKRGGNMSEKEEKYIDLVFVRHGNTDDTDPELLESGDAPLSDEGRGQAAYVGRTLLAGSKQ